MANPLAKSRKADNPYEVWSDGSWTWRVLKFYQTRENTIANDAGRVFCEVDGDYCEMGDVYYADIRRQAVLIKANYPEGYTS